MRQITLGFIFSFCALNSLFTQCERDFLKDNNRFRAHPETFIFDEKQDSKPSLCHLKVVSDDSYIKDELSLKDVDLCLKAWKNNPQLIEPLVLLAKYYISLKDDYMAFLLAREADSIFQLHPHQTVKFYTNENELLNELQSILNNVNSNNKVSENIEYCLIRSDFPDNIKKEITEDFSIHVPFLKNVHFQKIKFCCPLNSEFPDPVYFPCNPAIQKSKDGYEVICRTVNYITFKKNKYTFVFDKDGIIRTRNFLLRYDSHFNLIGQKEIVDLTQRYKYFSKIATGLEDARLFKLKTKHGSVAQH